MGRVVKVGEQVTKFKVGELAGTGCMVDSCQACENCKRDLEQYCLEGSSQTYNSYERDKNPHLRWLFNTSWLGKNVLHIPDTLDLAATARYYARESLPIHRSGTGK
ncbi:MAG: alcohol dehydrogenase catalytic domain-containing protein [Ferruginibacter sp.]